MDRDRITFVILAVLALCAGFICTVAGLSAWFDL